MSYKKANVNIALIKYWGKKNEELNIPFQSSVSVTTDLYYTLTNVEVDKSLKEDMIFLDGKKMSGLPYVRVVQHLNRLREYFGEKKFVKVTSENHVFIKAGFASSASAFAALTAAYVAAIDKKISDKELSQLARLGSGSAARSIHGGFVVWHKGDDHESSYAEPLNIEWPEFRMLFVLVETAPKRVSSRAGMKLSVEQAASYASFVENSEKMIPLMIEALKNKDLKTVGTIAEENAESMRNVMLEAGLEYHTPETQRLILKVKRIRSTVNIPVYYTFDAGPNLVLLTEEQYVDDVTALLMPKYEVVASQVGGAISDANS